MRPIHKPNSYLTLVVVLVCVVFGVVGVDRSPLMLSPVESQGAHTAGAAPPLRYCPLARDPVSSSCLGYIVILLVKANGWPGKAIGNISLELDR